MKIISYGTKNTPYEKVIQEYLEPSLKKFDLDYYIEYPEDLGSWQANTHFKAEFILRCLEKFKEPVVFIDADATILQYPELLFKLDNYDIGLHYLDWTMMWRKHTGNVFEALSGTLFINYTKTGINFIKNWIDINKASKQWEQRNMQELLEVSKDLDIYQLPYSYITIINHQKEIPVHMINPKDVIILHHQKSRDFKNFRRKP